MNMRIKNKLINKKINYVFRNNLIDILLTQKRAINIFILIALFVFYFVFYFFVCFTLYLQILQCFQNLLVLLHCISVIYSFEYIHSTYHLQSF